MHKSALILCSLIIANAANADIFKCTVNGKATYQAAPCADEKHETAIKHKPVDPMDEERARNLRELDQLGYQAEKAAKARTEALKASANLRNSLANDIAASREQRQQEIDDRREQWEYEQDRAEELARKQPYRLRGH